MKIGVTGTRSGMTPSQRAEVEMFLEQARGQELHHGDCVGVDTEVADIARDLGYTIVCHPPEIDDLRGFSKYDVIHEPTSYFARNRRIVEECDLLLVVPYQKTHQKQGGTWYAHDHAIKRNKPVYLVLPNEER